jgi:microcystin-dependent protein
LVPIAENDALFTLIGTMYGGDGQETFALPDLRGRIPLHQGTSTTGTTYTIGERAGTESVALTVQQIPAHSHPALCNSGNGTQTGPGNGVWASSGLNQFSGGAVNTLMKPQNIGSAGGSQPHENMMPFLVVSFIISLVGVFPSQN